MTRYVVSITIASPDLIVEANSPEEARDLANAFIDDKGADYCDLIESMDAEVDSIEMLGADCQLSIGIDRERCFDLHDLDSVRAENL